MDITNLSFERNNEILKITHFNKKNMIVEVDCFDKNNTFIKKDKVVFAQIPKKLKTILNPK